MTTKLREGDVVRWCNAPDEFRVERIFNHGRAADIRPLSGRAPSGDYLHLASTWALTLLRLLRRPVKVGDRVKQEGREAVVIGPCPQPHFSGWMIDDGDGRYEMYSPLWSHLDGTPIDPHQREVETSAQNDAARTKDSSPRPKFRVGDAVLWEGTWGEWVVETVNVEGVDGLIGIRRRSDASYRAVAPCGGLTLLRRPVQVGDVLKRGLVLRDEGYFAVREVECNSNGQITVRGDSTFGREDALDLRAPTSWKHADGTEVDFPASDEEGFTLAGGRRWGHADGTPIDPPNSGASAAGQADRPIRTTETSDVVGTDAQHIALSRRIALSGTDPDVLARALFDTDPDVLAFVREKADAVCATSSTEKRLEYDGAPSTFEFRVEKVDDARLARALEIAWERDEMGKATYWRKRAAEAVERLGGAR